MFCGKCQHDLDECTCPDLDERLKSAMKGGRFVTPLCGACGKTTYRCECKKAEA